MTSLLSVRVQDVSASAMLVYDIANTEHSVSVRVDSLVSFAPCLMRLKFSIPLPLTHTPESCCRVLLYLMLQRELFLLSQVYIPQ